MKIMTLSGFSSSVLDRISLRIAKELFKGHAEAKALEKYQNRRKDNQGDTPAKVQKNGDWQLCLIHNNP